MRRNILLWALAAIAAALAAGSLIDVPVSSAHVSAPIARALSRATGLSLHLASEAPSLRVLPRPTLTFPESTIRFADGTTAVSTADLRFGLRYWPLVFGRLEPKNVQISGGVVHAQSDAAIAAWRIVADRLAMAHGGGAQSATAAPPDRLSFDKTTLLVGGDARIWVFTELDGHLAWPGRETALSAALSGRFRGQAVSLAISEIAPTELVRAGRTPARIQMTSALFSASARGEWMSGPYSLRSPDIRIEAPALAELAAWLDLPVPLSALVPGVSLRGTGEFGAGGFDFSRAEARIGKDRFEGTLSLSAAAQPLLSGTLAGETLELAPLGQLVPLLLTGDERNFPTDRFALSAIDLRLSANRAAIRGIELGELGLSAVLKRNRLEMTLGGSQPGDLRGRLTAIESERGFEFKFIANAAALDLAPFTKHFDPQWSLSGLATGTISIDAVGRNSRDLLGSVVGTVEARFEKGELANLDLAAFVRRLAEGGDREAPMPKGRTPFVLGQISAAIWKGIADVKSMTLHGSDFRIGATGKLDLPRMSIDLDATLALEPPATGRPSIQVKLIGPLSAPEPRFLAQ